MVYYADDTVLFSTDTRGLNELLRLTEQVSSNYGLKLNRDKCVAIAMNNDGNMHFHDNTPLEKQYETRYLGNEINKEVNIQAVYIYIDSRHRIKFLNIDQITLLL